MLPAMKPLFLLLITTLLALTPASGADRTPNVVLLMADDLNTALSGFGHPQCKTPHLDALAQREPSVANAVLATLARIQAERLRWSARELRRLAEW